MHSYIISGGSSSERDQRIQSFMTELDISPFDIINVDTQEPSIGIADIRTFITQLQLKPRQSLLHAGVITKGELLTVAAQQALLKTLEEPAETVRIFISIANASQLLPTIISRCQIITLHTEDRYTTEELETSWKLLMSIKDANLGQRLSLCATIGKTKEELSAFLSQSIAACRAHMLSSEDSSSYDSILLHRLLTAKKYEQTNINLQLFIEHIFIVRNDTNII